MIHRLGRDEHDNSTLELDLEGIEYLTLGLEELARSTVGSALSTPEMFERPAPWWRFWNRSSTLVTSDFILKLVE
jgi:hypothetical protein